MESSIKNLAFMKNCFILPATLVVLCSSFCASRPGDFVSLKCSHPAGDTAATSWIADLRTFRDALYKNDTGKVKSYFKFPLHNKSNDIWFLVLTEQELNNKKTSAGKVSPFTEKDFNRYYRKIFPASFIKSLLKIKTDQLYKEGSAETAAIKEGSSTSVKMVASFDKKENMLTLNTAYNTVFKDEEGQVLDGGESNVIYTFRVLKNGHLQFLHIMLAG